MLRKNRFVLVAVAVMLIIFASSSVLLAAEKIGVIEPQKILFQHPKFESTRQKVDSVVAVKENEAKSAIQAEADNNKKAEIYQRKRQEAAMEEQKLMAPLFQEIELAVRKVAKSKGITVVLDKAQVFYGGIDLTNDVIQELKR
jgi:outer membrane protein